MLIASFTCAQVHLKKLLRRRPPTLPAPLFATGRQIKLGKNLKSYYRR